MTRPAWKLMNELPMFASCQTDELKNARKLAEYDCKYSKQCNFVI